MDAPGSERLRWLVEAEIDRRGWQLTLSPADAALMLTIGTLPAVLSRAADTVFSQMPQPRFRDTMREAGLAEQLDAAVYALTTPSAYEANALDTAAQLSGSDSSHGLGGHADHETSEHGDHHMADAAHDMSEHTAQETAEHAGHDMAGHGHMHHGGEVAGLAMAGTATDRDGLELDELKVTLGPVLPGWPTGLILKASMQGDVLTDVSLSWADEIESHPADPPSEPGASVVALDALSRFLLVAGWTRQARSARRARTELLSIDSSQRERGQRTATALAGKVGGSRALAWSVGGLGSEGTGISEEAGHRHGNDHTSGTVSGDVLDRIRALCAVAAGHGASSLSFVAADLQEVEALLEGAELARARLIVASFLFEPAPAAVQDGGRP